MFLTTEPSASFISGPSTQLSKISKTIAELYSVYPYEVASVLLEVFQSQGSALSDSIAVDCNSLSSPDPRVNCINESKDIIRKLSRKRPGLLLTMLKEVLGIIEAEEAARSVKGEILIVLLLGQRPLFPEDPFGNLLAHLLAF